MTTPIPWDKIIEGGKRAGGSIFDALGTMYAGREQRKGLNAALQQYQTGYDEASGFQRPIYDQALGGYKNLMGQYNAGAFDPNKFQFKEDPGYRYALGQGQEAITSRAGTGGMGHSPLTTKALMENATGMANQGYGDAFARNQGALAQNFRQGQSLVEPYLNQSAGQLSGMRTNLAGNLAGIDEQKGNISGQIAALPYMVGGTMIRGSGTGGGGGGGGSGGGGGGGGGGDFMQMLMSLFGKK